MILLALALLPGQSTDDRKLATLSDKADLVQAATTPDGRFIAFTEDVRGQRRVRKGEWRSKPFEVVWGLRISDDGQQVIYVGGEAFGAGRLYRNDDLLLEPKDGWKCNALFESLMSADGRVVAVVVENEQKGEAALAVNGKIEKTYPGMVAFPSMSRDGKVICFAWKRKDDKWHLVLDGKVGPECDMFTPPAVSEDGKTIAYALQIGEKTPLTIGGSTIPGERGMHRIFLSPDGKSHGFIMADDTREARRFSVRFGESQGTERYAIIHPPVFSPDQKHWASLAVRANKMWILVDQRAIETTDYSGSPVFSADGRSVSHWALVGRDLVWRTIPIAE